MAEYRRQLSKYSQKNLLDKYKNQRDAKGGIFVEPTRRRLLGVKRETSKELPPDTPDFWHDVRTTVKSGLKDLEMICDVAHPDQLEAMFTNVPSKEEREVIQKMRDYSDVERYQARLPSLQRFLTALFSDYVIEKKMMVARLGEKYPQPVIIGSDVWKAYLAHDILVICLKFFTDHNFVSTKAHARLVEEVEDMINVEVSRGIQLDRDKRTKGFV